MEHKRPSDDIGPPPAKRHKPSLGLDLPYEPAAFTQKDKILWITQDRISKAIEDCPWRDVNMSKSRLYTEYADPVSLQVYSPQEYSQHKKIIDTSASKKASKEEKKDENEASKREVNSKLNGDEFEVGDIILRPLFAEVMKNSSGKWKDCKQGDKFGPSWTTHWFKVTLNPKKEWLDKDDAEIHLCFNCSSEATLWSQDGKCLSGFAGGTDQLRCEYIFTCPSKNLKQQWPVTVFIEMSCNHPFGCGNEFLDPPPTERTFELKECRLGLFNRSAWDLWWDLRVLYRVSQDLPHKYTKRALDALRVTNEVINNIDPLDSSTYARGREIAYNNFFKYKNGESQFTVYCVGHCHIDTAWLWPYGETRRKIARSWASQVRLMEMYPDYHFGASQAQQFEWLLEDCPELFRRIQAMCGVDPANLYKNGKNGKNGQNGKISSSSIKSSAVTGEGRISGKNGNNSNNSSNRKNGANGANGSNMGNIGNVMGLKHGNNEGQFHVVGATWVEMDCNVPSGESFVRQFLYGQKFFERHFGRRCEIFWLPDTFGYSAQLPQIIRGADVKYFFTQKLSWNLINQFEHHSFVWEGIDGTDVLVHFAPADTYVSQCKVEDLVKSKESYKNKSCNNESMVVFGWGDGGGGPTMEHLERLERCKDLDGVPKVKMAPANDLFHKLEQAANRLPRWTGELYFELHRGTYTTHAAIKYGNRNGEYLLQSGEFFHSILNAYSGGKTGDMDKNYKYPKNELYRGWCDLLLNQFHDVLPGSSIELANIDARNIYKKLRKTMKGVIDNGSVQFARLLGSLADGASASSASSAVSSNGVGGEKSFGFVINTKSWQRNEVVKISGETIDNAVKKDMLAKSLLQQAGDDSNNLLMRVSVPSLGVAPLRPLSVASDVSKHARIRTGATGKGVEMENEFIKVQINERGLVTSMIYKDAANREVIDTKGGTQFGNDFLLFDDKPLFWDAWDVELYHLQTYSSLSVNETCSVSDFKVIETGPLRCGVKYKLAISKESCIECRVFLEYGDASLQFECDVDWHERHKMLKVQFPLNVRSEHATYEIQFGHLDRTTTMNTSLDIAKFEVCAQHWANLEEFGFGAALLNNCKYGYSCHRNYMRLSLLRASKRPDANADMHKHFNICYRLVPHQGSFQKGGVVQKGHELNSDLIVCQMGANDGSKGSEAIGAMSLFEMDVDSVVIDTVKAWEDNEETGEKSLVVRMYEAFGGRCDCSLRVNLTGLKVEKVNIVNLLEDEMEQVQLVQDRIRLNFEPFEIKSVKLTIM